MNPQDPTAPMMRRGTLVALSCLQQAAMVGVAVGGGWWLGQHWWATAPTPASLVLGAGLGAGTAALLVVLVRRDVAFLESLRGSFRQLFQQFSELTAGDLVFMSLWAGLGEEALFRGVLQPWIEGQAGWLAGLLVAAAGFGAVHFISLHYVVYTFVLGIGFGALAWLTGDVWSAVVAHAVFDAVALVGGRRFWFDA